MGGLTSYVQNELLGGGQAEAVGGPDFYRAAGFGGIAPPATVNTVQNTVQNIVNNITQTNGLPVQTRDGFLHALESWESSISLNSLWMVFFTVPSRVNDAVMKSYGEHILDLGNHMDPSNAGIGLARKKLTRPELSRTLGCVFAQTVGLPPEQNATQYVGPNQRGFLKGPVLEQRQQFSSINIEFLETGISFVDFLIRPWTIISGHEGYVARPGGNLGADIMLINFMRGGVDMQPSGHKGPDPYGVPDPLGIENKRGFVPRKIWLFEDCIPVNVSAERYSYTPEGAADRRDTEWVFKKYQIILPNMISSMDQFAATEKDEVARYWDKTRDAGRAVYSKLKSPHGSEKSTKAQVDLQDAKTYWSGDNKRDDKKYNQAAGSEEAGRPSGASTAEKGEVGRGGHSPKIGQGRTGSGKYGNSMRYAKPFGVKSGGRQTMGVDEFGIETGEIVEALGPETVQAKKYWRGERTDHHLAIGDIGKEVPYRGLYHTSDLDITRGGTDKPIKLARPYGVSPMDLGSEGSTVVEGSDGTQIGFDSYEDSAHAGQHGSTYYIPSDRENMYLDRGDLGLTMHDSNLYWQGKAPYSVKPTPTGFGISKGGDAFLKGGEYPSREVGPRGPISSANPYTSGRPDRMSILSLFGL